MLAEVLLVLAGHPSSFFNPYPPSKPNTLALSPTLTTHLHPGEVASLNILAHLAFQYTSIRDWARDVQERGRRCVFEASIGRRPRVDVNHKHVVGSKGKSASASRTGHGTSASLEQVDIYLSPLAGSILDVLREYEALIVETETRVLQGDEALVQDNRGYVPLSSLVATFSEWQVPLSALSALIDTISVNTSTSTPSSTGTGANNVTFTSGKILHHLSTLCANGNPRLRQIFTTLHHALQSLFLTHLSLFLLSGIAPSTSTPAEPCIGLDTGPDSLSPQYRTYKLNDDLIPPTVAGETRLSILYVGRVTCTLQREGRELPKTLSDGLRKALMAVNLNENDFNLDTTTSDGGTSTSYTLDDAVQRAREEIGEWLWTHILTSSQVSESLDAFGDYFLTRKADYAISVLRELHALQRTKLLKVRNTGTGKPNSGSSSSSVIREQDLNNALLRASVGTSAELDRYIERLRYRLPEGSIRLTSPESGIPASRISRNTPGGEAAGHHASDQSNGTRSLFSSIIFGSPAVMSSNITWPLDLLMTPQTISAYTDIHTYLLVIRDTHLKLTTCWASLSSVRRKCKKARAANRPASGVPPDGSRAQSEQLKNQKRRLVRAVWTTVRTMLFFLDELLAHFMVDVIDVQHRKLVAQLGIGKDTEPEIEGGMPRSAFGSMRGLTTTAAATLNRLITPTSKLGGKTPTRAGTMRDGNGDGVESPGGSTRGGGSLVQSHAQTVSSRVLPGTKPRKQKRFLDFLSLRQIHARHLASLREGLLLADMTTASLVRDVLETSRRFTGLIERWGGDVVPDLFCSGGEELGERERAVTELADTLHEHLTDLFGVLVDSQNPLSQVETSSLGSMSASASASRASRATQILQIQSSRLISRQMGAGAGTTSMMNKTASFGKSDGVDEALTGKHVEQLLLRLDFNGVLTAWRQREEEGGMTKSVLAEGGLS